MTEAVAKYIKKLHQLEKKGDLEVEDLLKILKTPNKEYITPLQEMVVQYHWQPLNDELIVPFASWVDALCIYLEEGVQGLVKSIHKTKDFFSIVFGVLEELPTEESLPAFLEIAQNFSAKITDDQQDFVQKYTYSLCNISHQLKGENASQDLHEAFVPILKQIISFAQSKKDEVLMCSAAVCFQAFGDKSDIPYLKTLSFTEAYYKNTGKTIAKRIEKKYA
ncbi:hypothetical protein [Capnocytophaga gingivalis]|uniref:Uncharacterized protein n=1 Tax=Capnocytophaga gingivalis TaxID=1017 RepID=A0ABU5Z732_9FLAO|nr:hypothetical protein [Capnocytophaga gingivalis]MEB3074439.1 hypothetical protein [Capnocytophaga gingivalis]